ncbi:MAG: HD domain-containing protein [Victivallales bacterium]|nr:HD domain-containing protein [Victivallales bacterium]
MNVRKLKELFKIKDFRTTCADIGISEPEKTNLTLDERERNKEKILGILLLEVKGREIEKLIANLKSTNFFDIGCNNHHDYAGGLAEHSLEVYKAACKLCKNTPRDSIAIVALLHDLGDVEWGQGHQSVEILKRWNFELKPSEEHAIKYHMWHPHAGEEKEFEEVKKEELWRAVTAGDVYSSGGYKFGSRIIKELIAIWTHIGKR